MRRPWEMAAAAVMLAAAAAAQTPTPTCPATELFRDDFSRFPPGWLSRPVMMNGTLNGAIQEYHYLPHRGVPLGPWASAIVHLDAWVAGDEDGTPYLEQHLARTAPQFSTPLFITGEPEWGDYTVRAKVRPLALDEFAGLAFRYATNRHYYLFALTGGSQVRLAVRQPVEKTLRTAEWRELGSAPFAYDTKSYYELAVASDGPRIRAYVDGKLLMDTTDTELLTGKVGLVANVPARYQAFEVSACPPARAAIDGRIAQRDEELAKLRVANPRPRLWKKFDTPRFGAGRNVRFGDLDGDGALDMLFAQNIPRIQGDTFDHISALTAVTLDGKVLWQSGRPDPRNGLLTNDTPFQIHDVDGDGKNDVILVRDFKLQVLDGRTGARKSWTWMPPIPANAPARPYELYSGDSIVFASLTGPGRRDLLLKDRYRSFWAFSRDLKPLWQGSDDTGHYPYPFDVDGDGRDELFIGHSLWDHTGRRRWSLGGKLQDHVDAVAVGAFGADPKAAPRIYWSSSDEAFLMLDLQGNVLKQVRVGHTQTAAVGKFRDDVPGLQYMTTNFWRNPGIMSLFDAEGNLLQQAEPIHSGSVTLPVNWKGDGQELVLLSGNVREGGMIDGRFRRVVTFPDDGHPDLTSAVLDLTGDPRDEIVLWDTERVWIYTQDGPPPAGRVYAPVRNPHYNDSNYRAHVSLPGWAPAAAATNPATTSGRAVLVAGAGLNEPFGVAFDKAGNVYIVQMGGNRVSVLRRNGTLSVLAGTGEKGFAGDGGPAVKAQFDGPHHLLMGPDGALYVADTWNNCVRRIDLKTGVVTRVAGTGEKGFGGDGGPAIAARFAGIFAIAFRGNVLYACDLGNRRIRAIDLKSGLVRTVAGNGEKGVPQDGEDALSQPLVDPRAIALDAKGNLYICERGGHALRVVDTAGRIRTVAGTGEAGFSGDGGPARQARLNGPKHISVDPQGRVLITDTENHVIRVYSPADGTIRRLAGTGEKGAAGLGGPPESCQLDRPHGAVSHPATKEVYISDSENHRVIRIGKQ